MSKIFQLKIFAVLSILCLLLAGVCILQRIYGTESGHAVMVFATGRLG